MPNEYPEASTDVKTCRTCGTDGENSHFAKLTREQVDEIISLRGKVRTRTLAERYGVSMGTIYAVGRTTWLDHPRSRK